MAAAAAYYLGRLLMNRAVVNDGQISDNQPCGQTCGQTSGCADGSNPLAVGGQNGAGCPKVTSRQSLIAEAEALLEYSIAGFPGFFCLSLSISVSLSVSLFLSLFLSLSL